MFECCQNCGHQSHLETCEQKTHKKNCPCKVFILQQFFSFNEIYQEYEKLLFQYEQETKKPTTTPSQHREIIKKILCINSKTRILKKWLDENRK